MQSDEYSLPCGQIISLVLTHMNQKPNLGWHTHTHTQTLTLSLADTCTCTWTHSFICVIYQLLRSWSNTAHIRDMALKWGWNKGMYSHNKCMFTAKYCCLLRNNCTVQFVKADVWDFELGDQPLQKPAFQPFTAGSNRYGWDHMAGKLVSPLSCFAQVTHSSAKLFH